LIHSESVMDWKKNSAPGILLTRRVSSGYVAQAVSLRVPRIFMLSERAQSVGLRHINDFSVWRAKLSRQRERQLMKRRARDFLIVVFLIAFVAGLPAVRPATSKAVASAAASSQQSGQTQAIANCSAFTITGDPRSPNGATWTYQSTDLGVHYALEGVLFVPAGEGPFPAVVISHGKGGTPRAYSANIARTIVGWGMVAIATAYTHAPDSEDRGNEPDGDDGASEANVLRAHKARDLLSCLGNVDMARIAAHGHSMGAFLTGQLIGTYTTDFRAASHTAGGTSPGPYATKADAARRIVTPYQLHHGDDDLVVLLLLDQALAAILSANGVTHELVVYAGYDHQEIASDAGMLNRVREWYRAHGIFQTVQPAITGASVVGKKLLVTGNGFEQKAVIVMNGKEQKTKNDEQNPTALLIAKKAGKKIDPGQTVSLQVKNPSGSASPEILFTRP
jgi:dienelactone hydrolase